MLGKDMKETWENLLEGWLYHL